MKIMHWNAEGISTKKDVLHHYLFEKKIDVCCIQETHLQENKTFKMEGYQIFRSDRKGRKKGGVMTLVRNNINAIESKRFMEEAEYLQIKISSNNTTLTIINYYCPNDKNLSLGTIEVTQNDFLIAGDFNSQSQSWGYSTMDKRGEDIESWQGDNQLILINDPTDIPTFYSRRWHSTTTPDLAFCTEDIQKNMTREVDHQLGGSDHRPVILSINGEKTPSQLNQPRWNYKKANWGLYRIRTNELTKDIQTEGRSINKIVKEYTSNIIKAAKETIPRGVRKNYTPYWNEDFQKTHEALTEARKEAERRPCQETQIKLQQAKAKHLRMTIESKRRGWREKTAGLNMEKDNKDLWRLTKALNDEETKGHKITLEKDGKLLSSKEAANEFMKAYQNESDVNIPPNFQKEARKEQRMTSKEGLHDIMQQNISMKELKTAINKLKKKKSPGPDNITNEMLQHLGNITLKKLQEIFNHSWSKGQVPQSWKEAKMIPIHKKGKDKSIVLSYRPISLTSSCCKTMEMIINNRLRTYLEAKNIIAIEQAGFRQHRSTEDQTTYLTQAIEDAFQERKSTLAMFIDLQKAFDKVWKDGLLVKLLRYGIKGNLYKWTKSYLNNRRARVMLDGRYSRKVLLRQGIPQGGVLSPTLFTIFKNDVMEQIPNGV